ncbi:hypothetical protein [Pseudomonas sp. RIT-PI-AD]|uniref:hypothetical protein n=1 Tax=Pseudomonas sp. RIT-PI-AD TaxID=3035294 RepID=UPI0021D94C67|nr:hypothetical protein [Pseudomonas sp. RIT-PI-AD]
MAISISGLTGPYSVSGTTRPVVDSTGDRSLVEQNASRAEQRAADLQLARERRLEQERLDEEARQAEETREALETERRENAERLYESSQAADNDLNDPFSRESLARQNVQQQDNASTYLNSGNLITARLASTAVSAYEETQAGPATFGRGLVV